VLGYIQSAIRFFRTFSLLFLYSIGIVVPVVVGRFTNGPRPLSIFLCGVPLRIASGVVLAAVLRHTKVVKRWDERDGSMRDRSKGMGQSAVGVVAGFEQYFCFWRSDNDGKKIFYVILDILT